MSEISERMKGKEMTWESRDKTSIIGRLLFNNKFDNLDQQRASNQLQEIINAFMH